MNDPVLPRETAPDHRPDFWDALESAMIESDETAEQPVVVELPQRSDRRVWPAAVAAAVLALVGLGVLLLRPMDDPPTELVVAPTGEADLAPAGEGVGQDAGEGAGQDEDESDETTAVPTPTPIPITEPLPGSAPPESVDVPPLPSGIYQPALGNPDVRDPMVRLPDTTMPQGTHWLADWRDADLSWFAVPDEPTCSDDAHNRLRYVNPAGVALPVVDHDPGFSGEVSHFTMSSDATRVAWLSACDGQLELYLAVLAAESGRLDDIRLAWVGGGSATSAMVIWSGSEVTLNGIDPDGSPFFVDIDPVAGTVVSGGSAIREGAGVDPWVVGATADGAYTYWNVPAEPTCGGETLYEPTFLVHTPDAVLLPALTEALDVAEIVAFDIDQGSSQVAFADACPGINNGRFFIGTQRADGRISSLRPIDISPFATGHVSVLEWIDGQTLRLHTDNSNTGGGVLRFDYRFDDGRDAGVLVQVD